MSHYESSLQIDLDRLRSKLTEMAGRTDQSLRDCVVSLMAGNRQLAYSIILRDTFIDALDREIDRLCLEFIIRQQPAGLHLRFATAAIKINLELERVGDYAKSIAKQALKLSRIGELTAPASIQQQAELAIPLVRDAIAAFAEQDAEKARRVIAAASQTERMRSQITEELFLARQALRQPLQQIVERVGQRRYLAPRPRQRDGAHVAGLPRGNVFRQAADQPYGCARRQPHRQHQNR